MSAPGFEVSTRRARGNRSRLTKDVVHALVGVADSVGRRLRKKAPDVADQLAATERRLEAAEARYQTYWEHTAECLFAVRLTAKGDFVYEGLNPAHERLSGLTTEGIAGKTPHECLRSDIADVVSSHYRDCVEAGKTIQYEEALDLPGGRRHWRTTLAPMRDPLTGRITLILGNCHDITHDREVAAEIERGRRSLAATNERLRSILASISDCYFTLDLDYRVTDINDAALEWLGKRREDIVGQRSLKRLPNFPLPDSGMRQALDEGRVVHAEAESTFRPGRWLDFNIYPSALGYSVFFRDVTERKLAVQTIEKTKGLLDSTINAMSALVAILDDHGRIILVNSSWRKFLQRSARFSPDDGIGSDYLTSGLLGPLGRHQAARLRTAMKAVLQGEAAGIRHTVSTTLDGVDRWYQVSAARFHTDGWARIVVSHEDVTEIRAAQKAVNDLSQRLLNLQEEERQRIAVELHDSTTQHLTAIGLHLMSLRRASATDVATQRTFDEIERSVDEAQKEIRVFSYLLYPPNMERDGLKTTLTRFIEGFARRTNLRTKAEISAEVDAFPRDLQRALLRIVQEALANVHRHASATEVLVKMKTTQRALLLRIADDGTGIRGSPSDNALHEIPPGVGLPGMHARVRQFGGRLKIVSAKKGTAIYARLPLGCGEARPGA